MFGILFSLGIILFATGIVVLIGGVIVEQGHAGKFASSTNMTSAWAPIDIWYVVGSGISVMSAPFIIRGFWNSRTGLFIMIPLFAFLSIMVSMAVLVIRTLPRIVF